MHLCVRVCVCVFVCELYTHIYRHEPRAPTLWHITNRAPEILEAAAKSIPLMPFHKLSEVSALVYLLV
jgi:hypothetical protein